MIFRTFSISFFHWTTQFLVKKRKKNGCFTFFFFFQLWLFPLENPKHQTSVLLIGWCEKFEQMTSKKEKFNFTEDAPNKQTYKGTDSWTDNCRWMFLWSFFWWSNSIPMFFVFFFSVVSPQHTFTGFFFWFFFHG